MSSELDRLRSVYGDYAQDEGRARRYDPDTPASRAMADDLAETISGLLRRQGVSNLAGRRLLEVGCGAGGNMALLARLGAGAGDVMGIDLLPDRLAAARQSHPSLPLALANAAHLPFPDEAFDVVVCFTVLSSVLDPGLARSIASEAERALRPGGLVIWYDLRVGNPRNRNVRGLRRSEVAALFLRCSGPFRSVTVIPPLVRALGQRSSVAYRWLRRLPATRTHWAAVLRKTAEGQSPSL